MSAPHVDSAVGLPLVSAAHRLPQSSIAALHHVVRDAYGGHDAYPRIYSIAFATERFARDRRDATAAHLSGKGATATRARVVVVCYDAIVVCDASGAVVEAVPLPAGLSALHVATVDMTVGVATTAAQDRLLTFAIPKDLNDFITAVDAVVKHHSTGDVAVVNEEESDDTADLLRLRAPFAEDDTDAAYSVPSHIWAAANAKRGVVHDRLGYIKERFAEVDVLTKEDAATIRGCSTDAAAREAAATGRLRLRLADCEATHAAERAEARALTALEATCRALLADSDAKREELVAARAEHIAERTSWQAILSQRQADDLRGKQRVAKQQEHARVTADGLRLELLQLQRRGAEMDRLVASYEGTAYAAAEEARDDAVALLDDAAASLELEEAAAAEARAGGAKRLDRRVQVTMDENRALRKLILVAAADEAAEQGRHADLREDADGMTAEVQALEDADKIARVRRDLARERLAAAQQTLAAAEAAAAPERDAVEQLDAQRPFLLVAKQQHAAARRRRVDVEASRVEQRGVLSARACEMSQAVFAEQLRMSSARRAEAAPGSARSSRAVGSASPSLRSTPRVSHREPL
jgi:hypothetical protein